MGYGRDVFSSFIEDERIKTSKRADIERSNKLKIKSAGMQHKRDRVPYLRVEFGNEEFVLLEHDIGMLESVLSSGELDEIKNLMNVCVDDLGDKLDSFRVESDTCGDYDVEREIELDKEAVVVSGDYWRLPSGVRGRIKGIVGDGDDDRDVIRIFIDELFDGHKFFKNRDVVKDSDYIKTKALNLYTDESLRDGYRHWGGSKTYGVMPLRKNVHDFGRKLEDFMGYEREDCPIDSDKHKSVKFGRQLGLSEGVKMDKERIGFYKRIVSEDICYHKRKSDVTILADRVHEIMPFKVDLSDSNNVDRLDQISGMLERVRSRLVDDTGYDIEDDLSEINALDIKADISRILSNYPIHHKNSKIMEITGLSESDLRRMDREEVKKELMRELGNEMELYDSLYMGLTREAIEEGKKVDKKLISEVDHRVRIAGFLDALYDTGAFYDRLKDDIESIFEEKSVKPWD